VIDILQPYQNSYGVGRRIWITGQHMIVGWCVGSWRKLYQYTILSREDKMGRKIDFFRWRDSIHAWKNKNKANKKKSTLELYREMILYFGKRRDIQSMYTTSAESEWIANGQPYYKVWPEMADALSNISIDIDAKRLVLPFHT
jgi:hypothetical protein